MIPKKAPLRLYARNFYRYIVGHRHSIPWSYNIKWECDAGRGCQEVPRVIIIHWYLGDVGIRPSDSDNIKIKELPRFMGTHAEASTDLRHS